MTERKKPRVAFWATVALVVVLAYPLSFGPVCWLNSHGVVGSSGIRAIYRPLVKAYSRSPEAFQTGARLYVEYWLPPETRFAGYPCWFIGTAP